MRSFVAWSRPALQGKRLLHFGRPGARATMQEPQIDTDGRG